MVTTSTSSSRGRSKRLIVSLLPGLVLMLSLGLTHAPIAHADGYIGAFTATTANSAGDYMNLPPVLNDPTAIVMATPNWNPNGKAGVFDNHQIGVWFNKGVGVWSILNEDGSAMPVGASFNVRYVSGSTVSGSYFNDFTVTATSTNTHSDVTYINNSFTNGQPGLNIILTQNWNPGGVLIGTSNNHAVGLWYDTSVQEWAIFNEDSATMPLGASFNVAATLPSALPQEAFVQTATTNNTSYNSTCINNPYLDGSNVQVAWTTPVWNPVGVASQGPIITDPLGVWYDKALAQWCIFDETSNPMPVGASFNVFVFEG